MCWIECLQHCWSIFDYCPSYLHIFLLHYREDFLAKTTILFKNVRQIHWNNVYHCAQSCQYKLKIGICPLTTVHLYSSILSLFSRFKSWLLESFPTSGILLLTQNQKSELTPFFCLPFNKAKLKKKLKKMDVFPQMYVHMHYFVTPDIVHSLLMIREWIIREKISTKDPILVSLGSAFPWALRLQGIIISCYLNQQN